MQKIFKLFCALSLMLVFFNSWSSNQVREYHLKNGLQILVKPDHRAPVVISTVWYKVGGSYEHSGITGISHVLEHMMFRGTKRFGPGVLDKKVSEVGGQQNAMTANDFTVYYQVLPANQLALSFELESDRMRHLLLTRADFLKEIQVVMEERRMRFEDNPQQLAWERFLAAAFVNNPYHHQAIGWMTDLKHMTVENVRAWYETWYQPNNAILVVVGDVEPRAVYELAARYFGSLSRKPVPTLKPRTEVVSFGKRSVAVNLIAKLPVLFMGYQTPTLNSKKAGLDPYALDILANVLGGSASSRLQADLVRDKQVASSAQVAYDPFNLHSNLLQILAIPTKKYTLEKLQTDILKHVSTLKKELISTQELARIKAQIIAGKVFSQDSLEQQAMILGVPSAVNLSWKLGENYLQHLSQVTPAKVREVANRYLKTKALTVAYLNPQASPKKKAVTN